MDFKFNVANDPQEEEQWISPEGDDWIVAVDMFHNVHIVLPPSGIHPAWLDPCNSEDIGMPQGVDLQPGLYIVKVNIETSYDYETGLTEFEGFSFKAVEHIWI